MFVLIRHNFETLGVASIAKDTFGHIFKSWLATRDEFFGRQTRQGHVQLHLGSIGHLCNLNTYFFFLAIFKAQHVNIIYN